MEVFKISQKVIYESYLRNIKLFYNIKCGIVEISKSQNFVKIV